MQKIEQTLDSMEVAEMVNKDHKYLMRDIRNYSADMTGAKISPVEFFKESTYKDAKGETRPCYRITKKGCEFIAHKLTGTKGTIFTARYINRFHEMEDTIKSSVAAGPRKITFLQEIKAAEHVVKGMNQSQKIEFYKAIYERHGLHFDIQSEFCIESKENCHCEEYRRRTIDAVRRIHADWRLRQICVISTKMLERDQG